MPEVRKRAERGMVGCCPKAYRWVGEMEEIGGTFESAGGFSGGGKGEDGEGKDGKDGKEEGEGRSDKGGDLFRNVGQVYRFLADETVLGGERIGERKRGLTAEDVAAVMAEGMEGGGKRRKVE